MPPPKRMTANPARPTARHRAGKPLAQQQESSSEEEEEEEEEEDGGGEDEQKPTVPHPKPTASSFPPRASAISSDLKQVNLNSRKPQSLHTPQINEDEFETEESAASEPEDSGSGSGSGSEDEDDSSEDEESSSEDEAAKRRMMRPMFIKKGQRQATIHTANSAGSKKKPEEEAWAEEQARKKERTDAMLQEQLERQAQEKAAGRRHWDDEDIEAIDDVDDTDDLEPDAEYAAWKLREMKRLKREQDAIIANEREREEVERRRNLTKEERDAEDKAFLEKQQEQKDGKGQMSYMQKYFHKGAFFTEDLGSLANRDIMGGRYEDDIGMKEALPEYMRIRDMTKLGKKGRTRYKDMKNEDTGRWGDFLDRKGGPKKDGEFFSKDDRFRPDHESERNGPSGANASMLGERKRPPPDGERGEDKRPRVS